MKTAEPKIIYLQIGEDADITEFKPEDFETNAITWCWERIFPNDIEYLSKQSIIGLIDEMIERANPNTGNNRIDIDYDEFYGFRQALTELKGKIISSYPSDGGTSV